MPNALATGVPYELFWKLNPRKLKPFKEAYILRKKDENMMLFIQGQYTQMALASTVGNMFKKRGMKPTEYPKEPFDIFSEKRMNIHENMTKEEKVKETEKLFDMLNLMQTNFELSHK